MNKSLNARIQSNSRVHEHRLFEPIPKMTFALHNNDIMLYYELPLGFSGHFYGKISAWLQTVIMCTFCDSNSIHTRHFWKRVCMTVVHV